MKEPVVIRPSLKEEGKYVKQWLSDPVIIRWFPLYDEREIDDTVQVWEGCQAIGASLTAYRGEEVVGIANLYIQPYEKLAHQCLFCIIVHPDHRNTGVGGALIDELCKLAKEKFHVTILHLEVYKENPAIHLYERKGFIQYGVHQKFIREASGYIDKIMMEKRV